jgi:hypothetical protein
VLFLGFHAIFCTYLAAIGSVAIYDYVVEKKLLYGTFRFGDRLITATPIIVFQVYPMVT